MRNPSAIASVVRQLKANFDLTSTQRSVRPRPTRPSHDPQHHHPMLDALTEWADSDLRTTRSSANVLCDVADDLGVISTRASECDRGTHEGPQVQTEARPEFSIAMGGA